MSLLTYSIFLLCFVSTFGVIEKDTVELIQVFFRHGSRTPEEEFTYPKDPYNETAFWPYGYGELTKDGKRACYKLGQILRERYNTFLGDDFYPNIVQTYSTDYDRTKISALLVSAGMFRPEPHQSWSEDLAWEPIPYNYLRNDEDFWIRQADKFCPVLAQNIAKKATTGEGLKFWNEHEQDLEYMRNNSGLELETYLDVFQFYQTLWAEDSFGLTLPEWTKQIYPQPLKKLATEKLILQNLGPIEERLSGGRYMQFLVKNMEEKVNGTLSPEGRKVFLYSGHEYTVIYPLSAMKIWKKQFPHYNSATIVELHYLPDKNQYAVKVLFLRDVHADMEELTLEGCDSLCPFDKFLELTKPNIPINFTEECKSPVDLDAYQL